MPEERIPKNPPAGEIAGANIGGLLADFIGELPADPQKRARYAYDHDEDARVLLEYRDILRDERCQAALDQRLDAVTSRLWTVEPGGESSADEAAAEGLKEMLEAIDFDPVCRQLLHSVWFGYAVAEVLWARDGSRVVIDAIKVRAPERFCWDVDMNLMLRTRSKPRGEPVPPAKFIEITRPSDHGDIPHGPGLARWCYWPTWLKRNGLKAWAVYLEKFGSPTPLGKYPPGATKIERQRFVEILSGMATGRGVAIPENQQIELLEKAQRSGGDFKEFVTYLDNAITTTLLGQSSTTDQGPWKGTAEIQKDVRDEVVAADAGMLDGALNRTLSRWLTEWNFPGAETPVILRDAEPPEDLDKRAEREERITRITSPWTRGLPDRGGAAETAGAGTTAPGWPPVTKKPCWTPWTGRATGPRASGSCSWGQSSSPSSRPRRNHGASRS